MAPVTFLMLNRQQESESSPPQRTIHSRSRLRGAGSRTQLGPTVLSLLVWGSSFSLTSERSQNRPLPQQHALYHGPGCGELYS